VKGRSFVCGWVEEVQRVGSWGGSTEVVTVFVTLLEMFVGVNLILALSKGGAVYFVSNQCSAEML